MILHGCLLLQTILSDCTSAHPLKPVMHYADDAEHFIAQCRRESQMFPRPHIEDVICKRIVSRDFVNGNADHWSEFGEPSAFLKRQAS